MLVFGDLLVAWSRKVAVQMLHNVSDGQYHDQGYYRLVKDVKLYGRLHLTGYPRFHM